MVIVIWLLAYTVSLLDLALLLHHYLRLKDKALLFLLLLIADMVLTSVVVMVLSATHAPARLFALVLGNTLLTYYLSVPYFAYETAGYRKPHLLIFATLVVTAVASNALVFAGAAWVIYGVLWAPLFVSFLPFFLPKGRAAEPPEAVADLRRTLGRAGMTMGAVSVALVVLFFPLSSLLFPGNVLFQGSYFAYFTVLYQLPVFYVLFRRIPGLSRAGRNEVAVGVDGLNLTPREEEVARRIFEGLTYEQIAEAMFVSLSAVKKHAYNIYRKTGVSNSRQLIQKMIEVRPADS